MKGEYLNIETAEKLAKKSRRKINSNAIKINKAIKKLEYYVNLGENVILNGNALKPILAVLKGE
jgi:hypothetical protein